MLIYNENRYVATETNMMIIRSKNNDGYYYIHRNLYDQAVVLYDKYGEDYKELCEVITGKEGSRPDVDRFVEELPKPINILGCFLLLVENEIDSMLDMIGAIHVMSTSIDFRKTIRVPAEMRASIEFSLSIREEYELPWDRFLKESIPWTEDFYLRTGSVVPMNGTATVREEDERPSNVGDDGIEYEDELEAAVFGSADDIFDMPEDYNVIKEDEKNEEDDSDNDILAQAMAMIAAKEADDTPFMDTVIEEPPKVKSGADFLRGL